MKQFKVLILISLVNFAVFFSIVALKQNSRALVAPLTTAAAVTGSAGEIAQKAAKNISSAPNAPSSSNSSPSPAAPSSSNPPPASTSPPAANPPPAADRCIIIIQGSKYDVTDFRKIHTGGDIFQCGTDMTAVFFFQHNQRLLDTVMQQYRVN
ncbi:hypothetical protein D4R52_02805 [bacterium]|nr:MAG: hypothetical protein D4R52_02805 [bacterium]